MIVVLPLMLSGVMAAASAQAVPLQPGAAAQAPRPPAPIAAAKDAARKVEAAQQKNADALKPAPEPSTPAAAAAASAPQGAVPASAPADAAGGVTAVPVQQGANTPITVIVNWTAGLKK